MIAFLKVEGLKSCVSGLGITGRMPASMQVANPLQDFGRPSLGTLRGTTVICQLAV